MQKSLKEIKIKDLEKISDIKLKCNKIINK